jgi:hypothetical protein
MNENQRKLSNEIKKIGIENLFVHAGNGPAIEQHDWIFLFVSLEKATSVENYGDTLTIISNRIAEKNISKISEALREDLENGDLSADLDSFLDGVDLDEIDDLINPEDIVDSAGLWDLPSFVAWISDRFPKISGVETNDGLAVVEIEAFCEQFCAVMNFDELYEVIE